MLLASCSLLLLMMMWRVWRGLRTRLSTHWLQALTRCGNVAVSQWVKSISAAGLPATATATARPSRPVRPSVYTAGRCSVSEQVDGCGAAQLSSLPTTTLYSRHVRTWTSERAEPTGNAPRWPSTPPRLALPARTGAYVVPASETRRFLEDDINTSNRQVLLLRFCWVTSADCDDSLNRPAGSYRHRVTRSLGYWVSGSMM